MAGAREGVFPELVSPFLRQKLVDIARLWGADSAPYRAIALQYLRSAEESEIDTGRDRARHFWARVLDPESESPLAGVERLYRRTALLVLTTACAAHCRWCCRGQYAVSSLGPGEIERAARFFGSPRVRDDLREVLITGGDPLIAGARLGVALDMLARHAPNIERVRIGTRVPFQSPELVDDELCSLIFRERGFRVEVGVHVNHSVELWPESLRAIRGLRDRGARIYNQNPLLKGVNDSIEVLEELYDGLHREGIESHYLIHCSPLWGMSHHRTTVDEALRLQRRLCSGGGFSGRAKPRLVAMTDIGKIPLTGDGILDRREGELLLESGYRLGDRLCWSPGWRMPASASADEEGYLRVWYPDGGSFHRAGEAPFDGSGNT